MDILQLAINVATQQVTQAQGQVQQLTNNLNTAQSAAYKLGYGITESAKIAISAYSGLKLAVATVTLALAEHIDDLQDAAEMYGYSATQIAAMKTAAADAGGSLEDITKASNKARKELAEGGKAYIALGIAVKGSNGELKSGAELASEVAKMYLEGKTTTEQFADVQRVLGKDVDRVATILASQADAIALVNEFEEKGVGIVVGATNATNEYMKSKNRATLALQSMGSILVANVLPAFTVMITKLTDSYVNGGLLKQAFDALISGLPAIVDFGGTVAKVFVTAFNVARAFGQTIGAVGAALVALFTGDFKGAKQIVVEWKNDIDGIDASNKKWMSSIDGVNTAMDAAIQKAKDYSLAKQGNGRNTQGKVPKIAETPVHLDESLTRALQHQQAELIRLESAYKSIDDVHVQTNVLIAQAEIANGKYNKQLSQVSATQAEELKQKLLANAADIDKQKRLNDVANAQKKANEAVASAQESSKREIEENRIRIRVLAQVGSTQDQVNVALAEYRAAAAEERLATEALNGASDERLIKLKEEVALLKAKAGTASAVAEQNKAEKERQDSIQGGILSGFDRIEKKAKSTGQIIADSMETAADKMGDAFATFVTTGQFNFKQFVASFMADIAKMIAKQATLNAMKSVGSSMGWFADGGGFDGGTQFFASGGVVDQPTGFGMAGGRLGVMGEAGPEAIMPLSRGADGKLGVKAASGGNSSVVVNNSISVSIGSVDSKERQDEAVRAMSQTVEAITKKTIADQMRQGGMFNRRG